MVVVLDFVYETVSPRQRNQRSEVGWRNEGVPIVESSGPETQKIFVKNVESVSYFVLYNYKDVIET